MKIIVNNQEFVPAENIRTAGDLYAQVKTRSATPQLVISHFVVDGRPTDLPPEDSPFPPPGLACDLIEITMESPVDILRRNLQSGRELLRQMREECLSVAQVLRQGADTATLQRMSVVFENTRLFLEFLVQIMNFVQVSFEGFDAGDRVRDLFNQVRKTLLEVKGAQEKGDLILLSDLLEYELAANYAQWSDFLASDAFSVE